MLLNKILGSGYTELNLIISIIGGIALAIGIYMFLANIYGIPTINSSKAINNIAKKQKETSGSIDVWLGNFASFLAKHIRLNEFKRQEMEADLRTAQIETTPEMFKANAIVKSLLGVVISIPVFLLSGIMGAICLGASVMLYFITIRSLGGKIKKQREKIEKDLPRLVGTIQRKLTHERGIIGIIESFMPTANPELQRELEITVADMRSGNEEAAITRLEARVGSPMMSDVCRGFITMIHGDIAEVYWSSIAQKFADIQRNRLRAEANKMPGKVRKLSMSLLLCFGLIFIVVIACQIIESSGVLFG